MFGERYRSLFGGARRRRSVATIDLAAYRDWLERYDSLTDSDRDRIRADIESLDPVPKVTVLLLVRRPIIDRVSETVESIRRQIYRRWQLLVLDVSGEADLPETLGDDPRIEFRGGPAGVETRTANAFLERAGGEFVVWVECGDELAETALYSVVRTGLDHPSTALIYSDEDRLLDSGERSSPRFKPGWSPDLLLAHNYVGGLVACRLSLIRKVGGFRSGCRDCLLHDFLLRCTEGLSRDHIRHLPEILYHRRGGGSSDGGGPTDSARLEAIESAVEKLDPQATVVAGRIEGTHRVRWSLPRRRPWVSVIIPTRNQHKLLSACLDSLRSVTDYEGFEAVVVDNQSDDLECLAYLDSIRDLPGVRVIGLDAPFNYSALNNLAVRESEGEVLAFLNNDIEILEPGWLTEMVAHAMRPKVGVVGAKLIYPDGTVQHGGVVLGGGAKKDPVAAHLNWSLEADAPGYLGDSQVVRNLSAVTAACMVVRRELFDGVGGFDETNLEVAFNDVDLCLRLGELGYWIVWTPYAELKHHESKSRGSDRARRNRARFAREVFYMRSRWSGRLDDDPFYSPNLDLVRADNSLASPPRRQRPWKDR